MAKKGEKSRHVLYLMTHQDPVVPAITCVCNPRYPKDLPEDKKVESVEPADMAKAYEIVKKARDEAKQQIIHRLQS